MSDCSFLLRLLNIHRSGVFTAWLSWLTNPLQPNLNDCVYFISSLFCSDILNSGAALVKLLSCVILNDCIVALTPFEYSPKWCTDSDIWLLHGWCHTEKLSSRRTFCVYHTAMHQITVDFIRYHIRRVHLCFSCNLPPAVLAEWPGFLWAAVVTGGGTDTDSEHRMLTQNKKILPPLLPAGTRTRDL